MERFVHQEQKSSNVLLAELRENVFQIFLIAVVHNSFLNKLKIFRNRFNQYICALKFELKEYLSLRVQLKGISCPL